MQQNKAAKIISKNVIFVVGSRPGSAKQSRSTKWLNQFPVCQTVTMVSCVAVASKASSEGKRGIETDCRLQSLMVNICHRKTCAIKNHFLQIILFDDQCLEFYQWHDVSFAPGRKRRRSEHHWSCWRPLYFYPWAIRARTAYSSWHASS